MEKDGRNGSFKALGYGEKRIEKKKRPLNLLGYGF